jgi:hypothetical protein
MMERLPRTLLHAAPLAAAFALACALLAPAAPSSRAARARQGRARQEEKQPASDTTIHGRAVYEDNNRPLRRARIMLVGDNGSRPEYTALTDADGYFEIRGARAGSYFAFADVPGALSPIGFVNFSELRGRANPDFTEARKFFDSVEVDGNQDARMTVHVRRGGALSGRVTYADGDPAVNVTVNVMRRGPGGRLEKFLTGINIMAIAGLRTDDRGVFRVSGLPPGEYILGVSEDVEHGDAVNEGGGRDPSMGVLESFAGQQFLMTFYPSSTSEKEAAVIKAEAGVERTDLDITIPERALHSVGGVARGKNDKRPVAGATVLIVRRDDAAGGYEGTGAAAGGYASSTTTTDAQGRWEFREIPEGAYTVYVKPPEEYEETATAAAVNMNSNLSYDGNANVVYAPPRRKKGYTPARREVQVIDGDVSEVAVELSDGGRVSGTIAYEGEKTGWYGYVNLRRVPDGTEAAGAEVSFDTYVSGGLFEIAGLPAGRYSVEFTSLAEGGRLYAKSVTWNGRDFTREPLELREGETADGVRILVSNGGAKLRARVKGKDVARGAMVFLVPADASDWSPYAKQFTCSTDEGLCAIDAPPGDYRVVALSSSSETGSWAAELKARSLTAPRVTLAAGESKEFEVALPEK